MRSYFSVSTAWAVSLIIVWLLVAHALGQSFWMQQSSRNLVAFGAIKGADFRLDDLWRLVASQWLHVKFPHMLLNALIIACVGSAAEKQTGSIFAPIVGLAGGVLGQYGAILLEPQGFISGASQAYMSLCGLALLTVRWRSAGGVMACLGVIIGIGLDVFVGDTGLIKIGHFAGLAFGLLAGAAIKLRSARNGDSVS
jgi:rhomboid protease GluP